ncbi:MAG: sterol desaturase family protein [Myxococcota bacterium]
MDVATRVLAFTALAGLTFIPLEHLFGRRSPARPGRAADIGFATVGEILVALVLSAGLGSVLLVLDAVALPGPLWSGIETRTLRQAVEVGSGLLLFELMGYAYHRAAHRIPALWRLHSVHHSSQSMDWLASFRQHPLEIIAVTVLQNAPLVLLGLPLGSHALVLLLLKLNTVFVHANISIPAGWWSRLIATPHFHHRHHQRDGRVANYAAMFPWIDALFGTFSAEPAGRVGTPTPLPKTFVGLMLAPFRSRG